MLVAKYKHKKDLKASIGEALNYEETSIFGPEFTVNGKFSVVGPGAYDRKWYAMVIMEDGLIKQVI